MALVLTNFSSASADLMLTFGTSTPNPLVAGQAGILDVFIAASADSQILDGFQVQLELTAIGASPAGGLVFSDPQSDSQLTVGGPSGYVFFGNSLSEMTPAPVGSVSGGGSLYEGYDATFDFVPVTLTTTPRLLYRLNLTGVTAGKYSIDANTFPDPSFFTDQLHPTNTGVAFTSTPIMLTVNAATAVPEASSLLTLGLAGSAMALLRARRRRGSRA